MLMSYMLTTPRNQQVCRSRADVVAYTRCLRHLLASAAGSASKSPQSATARHLTRQHLVQRLRDGGGGGGGEHTGVQVAEALVPDGDVSVEWSVYGAFSGEVVDGVDGVTDGGVATECSLNGGKGCLQTAELLVVCNKLETGFDEPRIAAMYVDRCLAAARCVQVLHSGRAVSYTLGVLYPTL